MADSSDKVAYYRIDLAGNARQFAGEASADMLELAGKINNANQYIKQLVSAQRSLKGSTEEVKAARDKLGSAITNELAQVGRANRLLLDNGTNLQRINDAAKAAAIEADKLAKKEELLAQKAAAKELGAIRAAMSGIGGPAAEAASKIGALTDILKGAGGGFGLLTLAAVASVTAIAAATAAVVGMTVALGEWIVQSANMRYAQQNAREAFAGGAENAKNWGKQIDALGEKVALSSDQLNKLAISLEKTWISGKALPDVFNAIGQATSGADEETGSFIQTLLTRGQMWNRFTLNRDELIKLQKLGFDKNAIGGQIAKNLGISLAQANAVLQTRGVELAVGAKAVREVVEKQFANINARKMLELGHLTETFGKHLQTLFRDVDFTKIAEPIGKILAMFNYGTIAGDAFKTVIEDIAKGIGATFEDSVPFVQEFVDQLALAALKVETKYYEMKLAIMDSFGDDVFAGTNLFTAALEGLRIAAFAAAAGLIALAVAAAPIALPFISIGFAVTAIGAELLTLYNLVKSTDWAYLGQAIGDGFVNGIKATFSRVKDAVVEMGQTAKDALKNALGINSPSKVFEAFGEGTTEGFAVGVNNTSGDAQSAVNAMVSVPSQKTAGASATGGSVNLTVNINVKAGGSGKEIADKLSEPSFLSQFTKALEDICIGAGVPVQATVRP